MNGGGESVGEGGVSGRERRKSGEEIKSEDKIKRTMHEKQPKKKKQRKIYKARRREFCSWEYL